MLVPHRSHFDVLHWLLKGKIVMLEWATGRRRIQSQGVHLQ